MRKFCRTFQVLKNRAWLKIRPLLNKKILCLVLLVLGAGIFFTAHAAYAQNATVSNASSASLSSQIFNSNSVVNCSSQGAPNCILAYLTAAIAYVLGILVMASGYVIRLLVEVMIAFAQYNSFGDAKAVEVGWVLVRDIVNMFFIVVILISAFATIIQYQTGDFHYTRVLPKLLLMAILINFSRTLILLLVDFSQVVMLTFVNAFKDAAAGNFVNALGLQQFLNVSSPTAAPDLVNVIISYLLALIFCIVTIGILLIMIIFLVYRIVILWVLLIASPLAFFATALPNKISKAISFTSKFWSMLTSSLTGGPVMAFFLWLTLATVQLTNAQGGLTQGIGLTMTGDTGFLNGIGTSQGVGTFVIGVAMLIVGLTSAVEAAAAVGAGDIAGTIKKQTVNWAGKVAKSPWSVTKGTYNAADRRMNITGKLSYAGMKTVGRVPIVGNLARPYLTKGMGRVEAMRRKEMAEELKGIEYLTPDAQKAVRDSLMGAPGTRWIKTKAEKDAAAKIAADSSSDEGRRKRTTLLADKYRKEYGGRTSPYKKLDEKERNRMADSRAAAEVEIEARGNSALASDLYRSSGNVEDRHKFEDLVKKSPIMESDDGKLQGLMGDMTTEQIKGLSKDQASSGRLGIALLQAKGALKFNKDGGVERFNESVAKDLELDLKGTAMGKSLGGLNNHLHNSYDRGTGFYITTNKDLLSKAIVQGVKGESSRLYNGNKNGERIYAPPEKAMETKLQSGSFGMPDVDSAIVDLGMSGNGVKTLAGARGADVVGHLGTAIAAGVSSAGTAGARTSYPNQRDDVQKNLNLFGKVMKDVGDFDMDSRSQIYFDMGTVPSTAAENLANTVPNASREQLVGMEEMVKDLYLIKRQNEADDKKGIMVSAARKASEELYKALQDAMPEHTETHFDAASGKTVIDKRGAVPGLSKYLHPKV